VLDFKQKLIGRGNEYFEKLGTCGIQMDEAKMNKEVFMNLISFSDSEYLQLLDGIGTRDTVEKNNK
jgi:hypothetical protein